MLGGCYAPHFERLRGDVLTGLASRALSESRATATVVPSALGPLAQLHGAAELCLAETLSDPTRRLAG